MITAFLLVRQGCLEGAQVFPAYQQWFQTTFGNLATSPASSKKTFAFLIKFLTDVVPFETALYLKAHLQSPPSVPGKCRAILTDYISLVKTRLSDLGESMEELGIYEDGSNVSANISECAKSSRLAEQDVEKALSAFNKTGKVPASIMEASIFRKPYFVGRFLPSLLAPRPLPDVPDIRMKFIEALRSSEKIAPALYHKYTTTCDLLSAQLLEGITLVHVIAKLHDSGVCELDDEMDDILLPPLEQLQHSLDGLERLIAVVSEKIHTCLHTEPVQNIIIPLPLDIDLDPLDVDTPTLKVVDILLNTICKIVVTAGRHGNQLCEGHSEKGQWLGRLLVMLSDHRPVMTTFVQRLFDLIMRQGPVLESHHVTGLAAVLIHTTSVPHLHKSLMVKSSPTLSSSTHPADPPHCMSTSQDDDPRPHLSVGTRPLVEELFLSIPCFNAAWMGFILRLCQTVRLPGSLDTDKTHQLGAAIYQSEFFQELLKDSPDYFDWTIQQWRGGVECGSDVSTGECTTVLLDVILNFDGSAQFETTCQKRSSCGSTSWRTQQALGRGNGRSEMVLLLQRMMTQMSYDDTSHVGGKQPWLVAVFRERLAKLKEDERHLAEHIETVNFFSETSGSISASVSSDDNWILGVDLCCVYIKQHGGETARQLERFIFDICAQKTSLKQHEAADVLRSFQECALSCLTRELVLENSVTSHLTHLLLQLWLDMPQLMTSLPSGHQMAVFQRVVLVKSSTDQLTRLTTQSDHLMSVLLPLYNECCTVHDRWSLPGELTTHSQGVNLGFMLDAAAFVRKILSRVTPSTLQRLDRVSGHNNCVDPKNPH
ncbi:hypothetical protein NP493_53g05002 [Ridgeia piscesae]|uniref:Uncharacterized protein n=1 Tax=Ridgeia piscesae TaxID=27915 RepID=A0AAD9PAZ3_RIDPI|nr:hypothetical protein NP493_53g05002 [Ridgeia piscesae]